ncbi:MAG: cysteine--tRNA ligase [Bacillota bacterium]
MRVYNDLTQQKEEFVPVSPGKVRFYNCGPTVYDYFHIGNARNFVVFDTVRRYLEYRGYEVTYVQNFTDIDDKMINRARERGITVKQLADEMIAAYFEDAGALGVRRADVHPRATELIEEQISMIQELIAKGHAYVVPGGDVYFRVTSKADYGKLSHKNLADLVAGASERVDPDDRKEHPFDFALWKGQKPGEPAWEAPWGAGRPGWHIECSAMARKYLGDTIDIHSGGEDLSFPHHENEIAQSECVTDKPFARYWLHNAHLMIEGSKMSKSKGNFFTVRDILKHYDGEVVRMFLLSAHYRTQLNFSDELVEQTKRGLERLYNTIANLEHLAQATPHQHLTHDEAEVLGDLSRARQRFVEAMDDDLNTADGIAVLFELARELNSRLGPNSSRELIECSLGLLRELGKVLGLLQKQSQPQDLDAEVEALIEARQAARKAKNWAESDRIRDQLKAMGIVLEDTPQGVRWKRA